MERRLGTRAAWQAGLSRQRSQLIVGVANLFKRNYARAHSKRRQCVQVKRQAYTQGLSARSKRCRNSFKRNYTRGHSKRCQCGQVKRQAYPPMLTARSKRRRNPFKPNLSGLRGKRILSAANAVKSSGKPTRPR